MSVEIFYGPGAYAQALRRAEATGRLLEPPVGMSMEQGRKTPAYLSVDEARHLVDVLSTSPLGSRRGTLVIGPLDRAADKSSDVLLKALEEVDPDRVQPFLWAFDLEGVRPTIRSRTSPTYISLLPGDALSPIEGMGVGEESADLQALASTLIKASVSGTQEHILIPELDGFKGSETALLFALCEEVVRLGSPPHMLWQRLRPLTLYKNPTKNEILVALMRDT